MSKKRAAAETTALQTFLTRAFHVHDGVKNKSWVSLEGRGGGGLVNTGKHYCTSMDFQGHNLIG